MSFLSSVCRVALAGALALAARPAAAIPAVGLTTGGALIGFDTATPGTLTSGPTPITNIGAGETLVGIDLRPSGGVIYGITKNTSGAGRVYSIDRDTAVASPIAPLTADTVNDPTPDYTTLSGTEFGIDFNPVPDRLRLVSDTGQNLRINVTTGATITDTPLSYAMGDPNAGSTPNVTASAYTNSVAGATTTTLYDLDFGTNALVTQVPPNNGTLNTVGSLGFEDVVSISGFDIAPDTTSTGFGVFNTDETPNTSYLYSINLSTGAPTFIGAIGGGARVRGFTLLPVRTPGVTNATTDEEVQTTNGLVITPNSTNGGEVTHFKITAISNGTLYQNDGTTVIANNSFITVTEGGLGLKFTPATNFNGNASFKVQASSSSSDAGLGGDVVTATITVNPLNDAPDLQPTIINGVQGQAVNVQLAATDAEGDTLTYSTNDPLPADLVLSSSGLISGTATAFTSAAGTVINVSVSDGNSGNDSAAITIIIKETPSLIVNSLGSGNDDFDGVTTLRDALVFANSNADSSTISFAPSVFGSSKQTIALGGSELAITSSITITGPGSAGAGLTIDAGGNSRVFNISAGTVAMTDLTLANGRSFGLNGGCVLVSNQTSGKALSVSLTRCLITGGSAGLGGGIYVLGPSNLRPILNLTNCTLTRNSTTDASNGGALNNNSGGIANLRSCTITNNSSFVGGGIINYGYLLLTNTIVAGNSAQDASYGPDIYDGGGVINSQGYNLIGQTDGSNTTFAATDRTGTSSAPLDPQFERDSANGNIPFLKDNGGPTQTIALRGTSPAVNKGLTPLSDDQRGVSRPQSGADDIGAFEFVPMAPNVDSVSPQNATNKVTDQQTFTVVVSDPNGADDIREVTLLINTKLTWAAGANLVYKPSLTDPTSGQLLLRRGDAFLPAVNVGTGSNSSAVLDNGAVRIVASDVTITTTGNTLTINLPVTIRDGLVGQNTLFARVQDSAGRTDSDALASENGHVRFGPYTVTPQFKGSQNTLPVLSTLSPSTLNTQLNAQGISPIVQKVVFYFKDDDGTGDLTSVIFLAGKVRSWANSATFLYEPRTRRLYLRSDDGQSWLGGGRIGTAGILENKQVKLDLSQVDLLIYNDGKNLGLRLPLQAKSGLLGQNKIWLRLQDTSNATVAGSDNQGYVQKGAWNVTQSAPNAPSAPKPSGGNS